MKLLDIAFCLRYNEAIALLAIRIPSNSSSATHVLQVHKGHEGYWTVHQQLTLRASTENSQSHSLKNKKSIKDINFVTIRYTYIQHTQFIQFVFCECTNCIPLF